MIRTATLSRLALAAVLLATTPGAAQDIRTGDLAALREEALAQVNASREANDLPPLSPGDTLDEIAQDHAEDMLARDYFAHVSPEGESVADRFHEAGGLRSEIVAENLARCDGCDIPPGMARVEAFQEGLMESPEHRDNILRRGLARFGYGIAADPESGRTLAVQTFAGPGTPRGLEAGERAEPIDPDARVAAARDMVNARREEAGVAPLAADDALVAAARDLLPEAGGSLEPPALDLAGALPADAARRFAGIRALAATCSGCGAEPTRADVRSFVAQWARTRGETLTDADLDRFGFALGADGAGAKTAILLLARAR